LKVRFATFAPIIAAIAISSSLRGQLTLSPTTVAAGGSIEVAIDFENSATCPTAIPISFQPLLAFGTAEGGESSGGFGAKIPAESGAMHAKATLLVPPKQSPGDYLIMIGRSPCIKSQYGVTVPRSRFLTVTAPTQGDQTKAENASEEQLRFNSFLERVADQAETRSNQLVEGFKQTPAVLARRKEFLTGEIDAGLSDLDAAQSAYREHVAKGSIIPGFFDDFRTQYQQLKQSLERPAESGAAFEWPPIAGRVSFQPSNHVPAPTANTPKFTGVLSSSASALWNVLQSLGFAYRWIENTHRLTFSARLLSVPDHAEVDYESYADYWKTPAHDSGFVLLGDQTDSEESKVPLAITYFKFRLEGCEDVVKGPLNPFPGGPGKIQTVDAEKLKCVSQQGQ
jgi:hypothetical protein